jgi:uncharacterized protein (TIGR02145 family)
MADGRYWMVQDMKFGNKCRNNLFSSGSSYKTDAVTTLEGTWYGNCTSLTNGSTPSARGYLYDWAAAINRQNAYYGGSEKGCSSTAPDACQGICPNGWHIPTGKSDGEYQNLYSNLGGAGTSTSSSVVLANFGFNIKDPIYDINAIHWHGVLGGYSDDAGNLGAQGSQARYWSSTYTQDSAASQLGWDMSVLFAEGAGTTVWGRSVRCVRNY